MTSKAQVSGFLHSWPEARLKWLLLGIKVYSCLFGDWAGFDWHKSFVILRGFKASAWIVYRGLHGCCLIFNNVCVWLLFRGCCPLGCSPGSSQFRVLQPYHCPQTICHPAVYLMGKTIFILLKDVSSDSLCFKHTDFFFFSNRTTWLHSNISYSIRQL